VANPAQAEALLAAVARIRPDLTAFFGCLYYGALRPEEATALRLADCHLPANGWGILTLTRATPRTAAAWTSNGTSHEQRGLKHRPEGSVRTVPILSVLVTMLRHHYRCYGTAPDGRLFRGTRGGLLSDGLGEDINLLSPFGSQGRLPRSRVTGSGSTSSAARQLSRASSSQR
jgi:integrase